MWHNSSQGDFRSRRLFALLCAVVLYPAALLSGCGGGSSGGTTAPPPVPDFSLGLNPSSISITPGGTAQTVVSLTALNGFSSTVSVQFSGLPAGVTASAPTYTVSAGSPQTVVFTAASNAAATTTTLVLTGTSASLTHTMDLAVQITAPPPDFSLALNPSSISITPGGTAQTAVSLTPLNGFSSSASVQISGLPAGVTASSSALTVTAGSPQTVTFSALSSALATMATVVFTGTSGSLTHTINLALQVSSRPFPDDLFMRLPGAEIGRPTLAAAYDEVLKEVFYSDSNFNSLEVFSTVDGHKVGEVSIPSPAGLEFSADFSKLYVGTITPSVYVVDPVALHVVQQVVVPLSLTTPLAPSYGTEMPVMPYPMADGSVLMGMGVTVQSSSFESFPLQVFDLVRYDPVARTFTLADPGPSNLACNPARSSDGNYLFVYGFGSNGYGLELYSAATQSYLPVFGQVQNGPVLLAANQNGSQYATVQESSLYGTGNAQINFWGANLQPELQSYTVSAAVSAAIYSRDGKYLYLPTDAGYIVVLDTQAGTPVGYLGFSLPQSFINWTLFDVDENYHLFGGTSGGAYTLNASQTAAMPPAAVPDFSTATAAANPNVGLLAGGAQVQFAPAPIGAGNADGIASSMEAYFGTTPSTQDTVGPYPSSSNGENFLTATAPPATTPGPVSVLLTDVNNNVVLLPDAFTYGPKILRLQPSAAGPAGGDSITIFAYGLGFFDLSDIHVTIGGTAVDMKNATLNSYVSNTFPEASVTIPVPPGTPGWADVQITTSNGTDTLKRGLQYLTAETEVAGGPFSFAVYDAVRNRFYLTGNGNTVSVFNASSQSMGPALTSNSISSGATLQQEAITPDSSKLLVVDSTDRAIIVFDLVGGTSTKVSVALPSDPAGSSAQPTNVVASANNSAFVGVTPCLPLREIDLAKMTVQGRTDLSFSCGCCTPYPEFGAASTDGSTIVYAGSSGTQFGVGPSGPEYVWSYNASTDTFSGPVIFNDQPWMLGLPPVVDGDGGVVGVPQGILDAQRLPKVNIVTTGAIAEMNGTGSLLYGVGFEGSQVVLSDTHNGRNLLMLQAQNTPGTAIGGYEPLAIDATGTQILLGLQNGLAYFDLAVVPLAVGTVAPVSAAAGATIQVRGSGFVAGTTVKIGGLSASCTFVDAETLSCTVPSLGSGAVPMYLSNPDGQTYSFENALVVP